MFLRPAGFASNNLSWTPQIRTGVVREAFRSRVHALTHDDLLGTRPVLTGPQALTTAEQVTALGDALSMPVRFEEISPQAGREEALASGWPPDLVAALFNDASSEPQRTTTTVEEITGHPPRSIRKWALDHADDFR